MSLFEFVIGMISVLIALAVVQLLVGVGRLVQARGTVTTHVPHTLWNAVVFVLLFLHWWSLWDFRDLDWNWAMFFFSLMGPTLVFFAATLLSPLPDGAEPINLEAHYGRIRRLFLVVMAVGLLVMTLDGPLFGTEQWLNQLRLVQAVMLAAILASLVFSHRLVQISMAAIVLTALLGGTIVRFFPGAYA